MHIILKKILLCCFVTVAILNAMGQTKFSAVISPAQIAKDEYATLRLIIENAVDIRKITPPSLRDFVVVSGPNQESGMNDINGVVNQYVAISYILQPRHTGNIVLPAATAIINGKNYSSSTLKLLVKKSEGSGSSSKASAYAATDPYAIQRPQEDFSDFILKSGERVPDKVSKNMQLKLQTSKTSCFVGEPIVASYKLYTRLKSESRLAKNPSFNGFSVIELQQPDETDYARERLNGREYNVYTIRKAQLYPLQYGTIEIESATLENSIQFLKDDAANLQGNASGYINGFALGTDAVVTESVSLSSKPVSIVVKPLPEQGKPASFNGAVGKFDITLSLEKNNFSTDENGKLTLVVSGQGNLQLVTAPDINWPKQLEAFEAKVTDELIQTDVPVSGKKIFEIPFVVQAAGTYEIPSVKFSFFDPASVSYKTISTKPISFTVQKGTKTPIYFADTASAKAPISFAKKMFENRGWIVGLIGLMIAIGLFFWIKQDSKKNTMASPSVMEVKEQAKQIIPFSKTADEISQNPLSLSGNCLETDQCIEFYSLLNQELKTYLSNKFSISVHEINAKRVSAVMDNAGIDNVVSLQIQQLMQDIEWQLYTPFERNEAMREMYNRSQALIQLIHTYHTATR